MLEAFIEFIVELIFEPWLGNSIQKLNKRIDKKYNKILRIVIKVAVFLLIILIVVGIVALVNIAIKGYWI